MSNRKTKKASTDKVRVRMTARQVVTYDQIKELTQEEWDRLKASSEEDAADWINKDDICDGEDMEEFDAYVVGADGKAVKPEDRYEGGR